MITDQETTFLYLSELLKSRHPVFFKKLEDILSDCLIPFSLLPLTKDKWTRDYMPIQVARDSFVRFIFNPSYLTDSAKWSKTITDSSIVCNTIGIPYKDCDVVLDGGNVVKADDKVILCDRIFSENPKYNKYDMLRKIEQLFEVDKIIIIPTMDDDLAGHADGVIRFYDNDTVLIHNFGETDDDYKSALYEVLHTSGLKYIPVPYNPYGNKSDNHANGIYINFLQMQQALILPVFGLEEDDITVRLFQELYPNENIITIDSNEIAFDGGVLNCITWNILV